MQKIPFDLEIYRSQMEVYVAGKEGEDIFWNALDFAAEAHADQWRRSGDAYILHPCSVAKILAAEMDITHPEILAASLLHDTVEDVEYVTNEVVREKFGVYVAAIVEGCTKVTKDSGDKQARSKKTHRKIFSGAARRPEVMLVKLADRLHNLRTLQAMPLRKQQQVADETLDIYAPLSTVFGMFNMKREMYNLALTFKFRRQWSRVNATINRLKNDRGTHEIINTLRDSLKREGIEGTVDLRVKDLWAYYDINNRILLQEIDFPYEILIVVDSRQSCYRALGCLNHTYRPIPRTVRDFIANPKPTGYQGLHARAIIGEKKYLFKIRTAEMARLAQRGLFRNWSSKNTNQRDFIHHLKEMFDVIGSDDTISYRDVIAASGKKEIYTYTPKGDLICLPFGSTVLDFAFRVHTDIGHACIGAMVGHKRREISHVLRDGDMVKIIRSGEPRRFDPELLNVCKLPKTRAELSKKFRARRAEIKTRMGHDILQQEMQRYGIDLSLLEAPGMVDVCKGCGVTDTNNFYYQLGNGTLKLSEAVNSLKNGFQLKDLKNVTPDDAYNTIELKSLDPVFLKLSSCCEPRPTEKGNVALLTRERLSVHRRNCTRLTEEIAFQREDAVNVVWLMEETKVRKPQVIHVLEATRHRIMMILSVAPSDMVITELTMLSPIPRKAPAWQISFNVANLAVLRDVLLQFDKSEIRYEFDVDY